jgi:hypothetical protein
MTLEKGGCTLTARRAPGRPAAAALNFVWFEMLDDRDEPVILQSAGHHTGDGARWVFPCERVAHAKAIEIFAYDEFFHVDVPFDFREAPVP